ncbi:hypothetical protein TCSYLVIO_001023 [Trypanosoma cruzi]|nr:hypothetical protein TCSYLVIO_001023 [Trypanosoma cruzi]
MRKLFCAWRCVRGVDTSVITASHTFLSIVIAVRHKSLGAKVQANPNDRGGAGPALEDVANITPRQTDMGQVLHQLLWRARDALLMQEEVTKEHESAGREKRKKKWIGEPGKSKRLKYSQIHAADATGLFEVDWNNVSRLTRRTQDGLSTSSPLEPTSEESIALLCSLLAVALKLRKGGTSTEFLSSHVTMTIPPLKSAEAVVAPLGRQARLWGELWEWQLLLSCASVTFARIGRECATEKALRDLVRVFLDKLDALCLPAVKKKRAGRHFRAEDETDTVCDGMGDTVTNALWRVAMLCRVMEDVLRCEGETPNSSPHVTEGGEDVKGSEKSRHLARVVKCVMCELEKRVFTIRGLEGSVETVEGLEALVMKSFQYCCAPESCEVRHSSAYKGAPAEALLSFCGAYFKMMPFCLMTAAAEAGKQEGAVLNAVESKDCCAVTIVLTIRQNWLRHQSALQLHGVMAAFWWLRLLPILLEGYSDVTAQLRFEHHLHGNGHMSIRQLETVQTELVSTVSSMLYFDEKAFEERRAARTTGPAAEEDGGGGDAGTYDKSDARQRRHRGGRSLFRKKDEKEGVLLPTSAEAMRKSSRFSPRRVWEKNDLSGTTASGAASGTAVNSPLFDMIVAAKDAVFQLSDLHAVEQPNRSTALEMTWLALLAARRRVEKTKSTQKMTQFLKPKHTHHQKQQQQKHEEEEGGDVVNMGRVCEMKDGDESELVFPPFVAKSLQHLSTALAAAAHRVYDMADTLHTRDGNIHRVLGVAIVAGTQEMLLGNSFYSDAIASNWWLRSSAPVFFQGRHSHQFNLPSLLESNLMSLLVQRTRRHEKLGWLKRSINTALECLTAPAAAPYLPPVTKQWTCALILSSLRDVAFLLRHNGKAPGATKMTEEEMKVVHTWACGAFSSLLSVLAADEELILLCGYASFIDALFDLHIHLGTEQQELLQFGENSLLKCVLPAVLISLEKSAEEDTPETHAAACESVLFVLAVLSKFVSFPDLRMTAARKDDSSDLLIGVAVYCLRHARRGGGKHASDYGLPAAQLPAVDSSQTLKSSGSISFLFRKRSGYSYLHVLDLSNGLLPFSRVQPLYGDREGSCVSALQYYLQNGQQVDLSSTADHKKLLEESVKCLSFMANTYISAQLLGNLVRFIEQYLRAQERLSRVPLEGSSSPTANAMQRESAMASLTRVETAPLVLLDYIGYLSSAGSWTMVWWAFNLAETALKIQRKHQLATTTSMGDVATRAVLSQLRSLSNPATPRLTHTLMRSILCLSDIMSESPITLLGFDRVTPLHGLLKHATRGEYRAMLFAMKQAVILVQRTSAAYRETRSQSSTDDPLRRHGAEKNLEEEARKIEEEEDDDDDEKEAIGYKGNREYEEQDGGRRRNYFALSAVTRTPEAEREFILFFGCLVACFDNVLDVIRGCALQQDILGDELRDVLLLALQTLIHVLQGCIRSVLALPDELWEHFRAERAHMLWISLCVAGLLGRVAAVDYGRLCFNGTLRRSTDSLLGEIGELVEACIKRGGDDVDQRDKGTGKQKGGKHERSERPLLDTLTEGLKGILSDVQLSHRLAIRLGVAMRQRTDLTAIITSLRAFAAASARYQPAGVVIHRVWRVLCMEVGESKKPSGRKQKRLPSGETPATALRVPSIDELQLLLESFRDLENELTSVAATRKTQRRHAEFVVDWTCEKPLLMLERVTEDLTLVQSDQKRNVALENKGDDGDAALLDMGVAAGESQDLLTTGTLGGMDAAILLQEEEEEGKVEGKAKETIPNGELIEALIRQCGRVQTSSAVLPIVDAALSIPQTNRVLGTHFNCVKTVFARCTLAEIVALPHAELIFGSLELFVRRRSPAPLEERRNLWLQLTQKWKREFLEPYSLRFEELQREFLLLVRQRRSSVRLGEGRAAVNSGTPLFSPCGNVMAQIAKQGVIPVACDVEISPHDDIGGLLVEEKGKNSRGMGRCDYEQLLKQQRYEQQQKPSVPLDILFTILTDLSRGPRGEAGLEDFARVFTTYIAREYFLLRQRMDGNAMNVMRFMQNLHQLGPRIYQRRRLPVSCAHATDVAGWFLTPADRQSVMTALSHISEGVEVEAFNSAEHGVFEYMRSLCLYLHLLALTVHVFHRFRMHGDSEMRDGVRQRRQPQQQQQQQQHGRCGFEEDVEEEGGDAAQWSEHRSQDAEARLAERQLHADTRQTDPDSVNMNLLESSLLHFLNVSLVLVDHTDLMIHRATSIATAPDSDHEHARKALLYADELRLMVAVALQDTIRVLLRDAPLRASFARRVVHRIICSFSCDILPEASWNGTAAGKQNEHSSQEFSVNMIALDAWRSKRPELFVRSPTLLCLLSPSFFNEVLSQNIRNALSLTLTQVVASLHFYLRRTDAHLSPLMTATTSILSNTYVRNAALRLFCEELCGQIVERTSFREALAPPTVASVQQGVAGSVPDEVLIPFLASICREDAFVSKNALASVLYHSMSLRPDVFGQPPIVDRFARFAIARRGSSSSHNNNNNSGSVSPLERGGVHGNDKSAAAAPVAAGVGSKAGVRESSAKSRLSLGVSNTDVVLESPISSNAAEATSEVMDVTSTTQAADEEEDEVETLSRFMADQSDETATRTHKRTLFSLNLTLAEVMETAMHFSQMRPTSPEEYKKAMAMIRAADDARHERIAAFRSATPTTGSHNGMGSSPSSSLTTTPTVGYPDAALHIEEPMHFGVVMLHIRFALRKIIHASMRRLAAQQGPKTLSMMVEMLREVDPKWHQNQNNNSGELRRQSDSMLAGTLRVLVARSVVCVDLVGEAGDLLGGGAGGLAISAVGLQRTERALHLVQRAKRSATGSGGNTGGHVSRRPPQRHRGDGSARSSSSGEKRSVS